MKQSRFRFACLFSAVCVFGGGFALTSGSPLFKAKHLIQAGELYTAAEDAAVAEADKVQQARIKIADADGALEELDNSLDAYTISLRAGATNRELLKDVVKTAADAATETGGDSDELKAMNASEEDWKTVIDPLSQAQAALVAISTGEDSNSDQKAAALLEIDKIKGINERIVKLRREVGELATSYGNAKLALVKSHKDAKSETQRLSVKVGSTADALKSTDADAFAGVFANNWPNLADFDTYFLGTGSDDKKPSAMWESIATSLATIASNTGLRADELTGDEKEKCSAAEQVLQDFPDSCKAMFDKLLESYKTQALNAKTAADNMLLGKVGGDPEGVLSAAKQAADTFAVASGPKGWAMMSSRYRLSGRNYRDGDSGFVALKAEFDPLMSSVQLLEEAIEGDVSSFVTDRVNLYYFTDVKRLILTLNDNVDQVGGSSGAENEYITKKKELDLAQKAMREAYDDLTQKTNSLIALQVQQKALEGDLLTKTRVLNQIQGRYDDADRADDIAQQKLTDAKTASYPDAKKKKAAMDRAQKRADETSKRKNLAQRDLDKAQADKDASQTEHDKNADDLKSTQDEMTVVQKAVVSASSSLKEKRYELAMASGGEMEAFAFRRDNQPFIVTRARAGSSDPAKRVRLYAFNDSKTIFIRGLRTDVEDVKEIISQFDSPAPQARITLWTLQVNSLASRAGRASLGNALETIDKRLTTSRGYMAAAISMLQDCLNSEVHYIEGNFKAKYSNATGDQMRLARLNFYETEVLRRLGLDPVDAQKYPENYYFTNYTLPDPAGTTTLGESMIVLSLAKQPFREEILCNYMRRLKAYVHEQKKVDPKLSEDGLAKNLLRAFNCDTAAIDACSRRNINEGHSHFSKDKPSGEDHVHYDSTSDGLTARQAEIVLALKRSTVEKVINNSPALALYYALYRDQIGSKVPLGLVETMGSGLRDLRNQGIAKTETADIACYLWPLFSWLKHEVGLVPDAFTNAIESEDSHQRNQTAIENYKSKTIRYFRAMFPLEDSNARIAAADEMLKELVIAMEDDLDRTFVQPLLYGLRRDISAQNVDVGIVERTSVLATNRYIAQVDPKASAQLDLAGQEDLLASAQQLVQFATAVQSAGLTDVFRAAGRLPNEEPKSELYALFSGSKFQVTPIFDPSGQALRFQFDYVKNTDVRDPDGTVNPQLPRVDSHAVNAMVQLSNLELREVTRFENNTKLGVPPKQWGGIPILNTMPGLRELPLIGYFGKRNGFAGTSQASLIFAQTAMYPTIGDLSELLTNHLNLPVPTKLPKDFKQDLKMPSFMVPGGGEE